MRRVSWQEAPDIKKGIKRLVRELELDYIPCSRIFCFRSFGSSSRARARIWSLPRIWQKALSEKPAYCLEVLSEKFDKLSEDEKIQVLLHELVHIPKNFSGTLLPHLRRRRHLPLKYFKLLKRRRESRED